MKSLIARRLELERMTEIPDMDNYSSEWNKLAADFSAHGMLSNASLCLSKAEYYSKMTGEYLRVIDNPIVALSPSAPMNKTIRAAVSSGGVDRGTGERGT